MAIEIKRTRILQNKPIYLGLSILEKSKMVMYEFWYDYMKLKHREKAKLYYMDIDSFVGYIKTEDIYSDIAKDVETRFEASNCKLDRPLLKRKKKNIIGLMKYEFCGSVCWIETKNIQLVTDDNDENKKPKGTKKGVIKRN